MAALGNIGSNLNWELLNVPTYYFEASNVPVTLDTLQTSPVSFQSTGLYTRLSMAQYIETVTVGGGTAETKVTWG